MTENYDDKKLCNHTGAKLKVMDVMFKDTKLRVCDKKAKSDLMKLIK